MFLLENILSKQNNIQDDSAWAHVLLSLSFFFCSCKKRENQSQMNIISRI